jgi:hypothetical protein
MWGGRRRCNKHGSLLEKKIVELSSCLCLVGIISIENKSGDAFAGLVCIRLSSCGGCKVRSIIDMCFSLF